MIALASVSAAFDARSASAVRRRLHPSHERGAGGSNHALHHGCVDAIDASDAEVIGHRQLPG